MEKLDADASLIRDIGPHVRTTCTNKFEAQMNYLRDSVAITIFSYLELN